ncbi:hypothetical protein F5148DRAFT_1147914 [Russula earlei]|uniref:Uncharacterized protein n=1 Tax=Russula earlei TaxID=71964 RepID=A0ACC0UFW2_9AGAM|nr:hypothetical protein F5148DRAFT_1147914 [Russula earlei]
MAWCQTMDRGSGFYREKKSAPAIIARSVTASNPRSLLEYLDLSQSTCLNEVAEHNLKDIFNQAVRVKSIVLNTADSQKGPKLVKLFVNRLAIDFEDVEDAEEPEVAQILEVPEDAVREGRPIDLRFVRFQSVNSLHRDEGLERVKEATGRLDKIAQRMIDTEIPACWQEAQDGKIKLKSYGKDKDRGTFDRCLGRKDNGKEATRRRGSFQFARERLASAASCLRACIHPGCPHVHRYRSSQDFLRD